MVLRQLKAPRGWANSLSDRALSIKAGRKLGGGLQRGGVERVHVVAEAAAKDAAVEVAAGRADGGRLAARAIVEAHREARLQAAWRTRHGSFPTPRAGASGSRGGGALGRDRLPTLGFGPFAPEVCGLKLRELMGYPIRVVRIWSSKDP